MRINQASAHGVETVLYSFSWHVSSSNRSIESFGNDDSHPGLSYHVSNADLFFWFPAY